MTTYDDTLQVGDLITSYSKGVFRIADIQRRFYTADDEAHFDHLEAKHGERPKVGDEYNPLVVSRRLLDSKHKKRGGMESCDAAFCARLGPAEQQEVEAILEADPSIEENSIKKYRAALQAKPKEPAAVSDEEVRGIKAELARVAVGEHVEVLLQRLCPSLFSGIEIANGYVNSGKQFAVHLNDNYAISIVYNEIEGGITQYVSGKIVEKAT